jgi:trypsin-like peptidase
MSVRHLAPMSRPSGAWSRRVARLLGALCALALAVAVPLLSPGAVAAAGRPPGGSFDNPVIREIDIASPAVVRIATITTGHIAFALCGSTAPLPEPAGGFVMGGLGSGAFVSSHGDILTADHVVDIAKADLDTEWFQSPGIAAAIAQLFNGFASCLGLPRALTGDDILAGFVQAEGISFTTHYDPLQRLVWRSTAFSGHVGSGGSASSYTRALLPVQHENGTVVTSSAPDDDDVAVLHIDQTDTPSIPLEDASTLAVQDKLTEIGFPGNADLVSHFDQIGGPDSLLTPSVNTLTISALKPNFNGSTLILVAGNVEHGDSGGPALNAAGHLVGVASFGGDTDPVGTSYFRSSTQARQLLADARIDTAPGAFQTLWRQAFLDYAAATPGHWHTAARELDDLAARYPAFGAVKPYRDYADQAAATEVPLDTAGVNGAVVGALAAAAAALIALVALLVFLFARRRRARRVAVAAAVAATQIPAGYAYPYPSYPYPAAGYGAPQSSGYGYTPPAPVAIPVGAGAPATSEASSSSPGAVSLPSAPSASSPSASAFGGGVSPASSAPFATSTSSPWSPPAPASSASSASASLPDARVAPYGSFGSYGAYGQNGQNGQSLPGICVNGHRMPPGEARCMICGAARAEMPPR